MNDNCTYIRIGGLVMTGGSGSPYALTLGIVDDFGNLIHILDTDHHASSIAVANFD